MYSVSDVVVKLVPSVAAIKLVDVYPFADVAVWFGSLFVMVS